MTTKYIYIICVLPPQWGAGGFKRIHASLIDFYLSLLGRFNLLNQRRGVKAPIMNNQQFEEFIDSIYSKAEGNPEHLADSIDDKYKETFKQVFEITINLNEKDLHLLQYIELYKDLFETLKFQRAVTRGSYEIEYCKSGLPHLHGFLEIEYPYSQTFLNISDECLLNDFIRPMFLKLPKRYWIQYTRKHTFKEHFRQWKSAAVCINLKNILSSGWVEYMKKTHV